MLAAITGAREVRAVGAAVPARALAGTIRAARAVARAIAGARQQVARIALPAALAVARTVDAEAMTAAVRRRRARALVASFTGPSRLARACE